MLLLNRFQLLGKELWKWNHHMNDHDSIWCDSSQLLIIHHLSINTVWRLESTNFLILIIKFDLDRRSDSNLWNHLYGWSSYMNVWTILLSHYTQSIQSFILSINHYIHSLPSSINSFIFSSCISQQTGSQMYDCETSSNLLILFSLQCFQPSLVTSYLHSNHSTHNQNYKTE